MIEDIKVIQQIEDSLELVSTVQSELANGTVNHSEQLQQVLSRLKELASQLEIKMSTHH